MKNLLRELIENLNFHLNEITMEFSQLLKIDYTNTEYYARNYLKHRRYNGFKTVPKKVRFKTKPHNNEFNQKPIKLN